MHPGGLASGIMRRNRIRFRNSLGGGSARVVVRSDACDCWKSEAGHTETLPAFNSALQATDAVLCDGEGGGLDRRRIPRGGIVSGIPLPVVPERRLDVRGVPLPGSWDLFSPRLTP